MTDKLSKPNGFKGSIAAATALAHMSGFGEQEFWKKPHGEPEWVEIPKSMYLMGEKGKT